MRRAADGDLPPGFVNGVGPRHIGTHQEITPTRVRVSEDGQVPRVESIGVDLGLDSVNPASPAFDDKVDLMLTVIAPVVNLPAIHGSTNLVQHEMLPEVSAISLTYPLPSADVGDEAGVKCKDPGLPGDFITRGQILFRKLRSVAAQVLQ